MAYHREVSYINCILDLLFERAKTEFSVSTGLQSRRTGNKGKIMTIEVIFLFIYFSLELCLSRTVLVPVNWQRKWKI